MNPSSPTLKTPDQLKIELQTKVQLKKELDRRLVEARALDDFPYFVNHVFAASFDQFTGGPYIDSVARFRAGSKRTARAHFISTSSYDRSMYHLFRSRSSQFEAHYFSYDQSMSGYHIGKIKEMVKANPFFDRAVDLKPNAETVGAWSWDGVHEITLDPKSLLLFKRGIHPDWIAVDAPFQDPENKLEPTKVLKVNDVFKKQILDMPKAHGELHVVGTAQTSQDFFFDTQLMARFSVLVQPAMVSRAKRIALWPEWMSFEELELREQERGPKVFAQEYLCSPVYTEDAWLEEDEFNACVDTTLINLNSLKMPEDLVLDGDITAGWDLGKKRHPSHFVVFETKDGYRRSYTESGWKAGTTPTRVVNTTLPTRRSWST